MPREVQCCSTGQFIKRSSPPMCGWKPSATHWTRCLRLTSSLLLGIGSPFLEAAGQPTSSCSETGCNIKLNHLCHGILPTVPHWAESSAEPAGSLSGDLDGYYLWMYHDLISDISRGLTRRSIMHYRGDDGVLWPMTRLRWRKSFRFCILGQ
jgi:hypothetical protein